LTLGIEILGKQLGFRQILLLIKRIDRLTRNAHKWNYPIKTPPDKQLVS
jgi:hypothetical protein